jgi:hypothetical protein
MYLPTRFSDQLTAMTARRLVSAAIVLTALIGCSSTSEPSQTRRFNLFGRWRQQTYEHGTGNVGSFVTAP